LVSEAVLNVWSHSLADPKNWLDIIPETVFLYRF